MHCLLCEVAIGEYASDDNSKIKEAINAPIINNKRSSPSR